MTISIGAPLDANGNVQVNLPAVDSQSGYVRMLAENDPGTITGAALLRSPEVSEDYRMRVGLDTLLFTDNYNATAQNTSLYSYTFNTLTAAQSGNGAVTFSNVQGTTSAHGAFMRTFQYFPVIGTAPLAVEFTFGQFTSTLVSNELWLCGLGLPSAATTAPTDGVWFQLTSAGLIGVLAYNSVTTQTGVLLPIGSVVLGTIYKAVIVVGERELEFWWNDVLLGTIDVPSGNGQPFLQASLPVFMHKYNTGAVANTNTIRVTDLTVTLYDIQTTKPWSAQMACQGMMAYQGQNGGTMGTTALYPNATAATTVTGGALSQTVAIATGLGGQAGIVAAVPGIDGIVTAFQNPTGGINQSARNLVITGVRIDSCNIGAAVATTASVLSWSLAFGATGAAIPSLAQAESASFATGTAKAWRRIPLGMQSWVVGAAIGQGAEAIKIDFNAPVVVHPGQWVAVVAKFLVGTATASQVIWTTTSFNAYYE